MFSCVIVTRRPRYGAGESSAMYTGAATEAPPTARPPMKRKARNEDQLQESAQPSAEVKKRSASAKSTPRLPKASVGLPMANAPPIEPSKAVATVNLSSKLLS